MDLANVLRSEENVKSSARLAREGLRMAKQMGDLEHQVGLSRRMKLLLMMLGARMRYWDIHGDYAWDHIHGAIQLLVFCYVGMVLNIHEDILDQYLHVHPFLVMVWR